MRKAAGNYKYDPTHTHKPKEGRWEKTDRGWSRRAPSSQKGTGAASRLSHPLAVIDLPPPSKPLRKRMAVFAKSKFRGFFNGGMAGLAEASAEVDNIVGDQRAKNPDLNHLIRCYADHKMLRVVPGLSAHLSRFFGLDNTATDFRTKGVNDLPPSPPELLQRLGDLLSYEQAVIRAAGLVNSDGTVTLFRSCGKDQLGEPRGRHGKAYSGSNIESWSLRPNLKWKGKKVMAKVPLKYCIASCIGRKDRPFMHPEQSEIVVCGTFIKEVQPITAKRRGVIRETVIRALRGNMLARFSEGKKASRNAARCGYTLRMRIGKALLSLASEVLRGKVGHDGLYYGKRSIYGKCGDWAVQRRMTMPRKRKKELRVEDDPLLYYIEQTGSLGDAIDLAEKWEKEHGIDLGPPINTNTPEEDRYLAQMRRWTDFVTSRGYSIAEERTSVYRRLWREFIAEEHARDPSIPISEWDD